MWGLSCPKSYHGHAARSRGFLLNSHEIASKGTVAGGFKQFQATKNLTQTLLSHRIRGNHVCGPFCGEDIDFRSFQDPKDPQKCYVIFGQNMAKKPIRKKCG